MRDSLLLLLLTVFSVSVSAQKTVTYSDNAFKVAKIPAVEDLKFKNLLRQWLDTTLVPILDSLKLKASLPGDGSRVKVFAFNDRNLVLPVKLFDEIEAGVGHVEIRDDSLETYFSVSFHNTRFLNMYMISPIPVNKLTVTQATLYNYHGGGDEWFSVNKKDKYSNKIDIKIKNWELQFDTFPGYDDTIPIYAEKFDINGDITFTTGPLYYHKSRKQKKGELCNIRVRMNFKTRRTIRNTNYVYDENDKIIKKNKN